MVIKSNIEPDMMPQKPEKISMRKKVRFLEFTNVKFVMPIT